MYQITVAVESFRDKACPKIFNHRVNNVFLPVLIVARNESESRATPLGSGGQLTDEFGKILPRVPASVVSAMREKKMTAQRRTAAALSGLALLAFAPFSGGCGPIFETNEAACVRMTTYFLTCGSPADAPPEFDFFIAQICAPVPETSECDDWPAFADCVTSVSCTDLFSFAAELEEMCGDLEAGLKNNGCVP